MEKSVRIRENGRPVCPPHQVITAPAGCSAAVCLYVDFESGVVRKLGPKAF